MSRKVCMSCHSAIALYVVLTLKYIYMFTLTFQRLWLWVSAGWIEVQKKVDSGEYNSGIILVL